MSRESHTETLVKNKPDASQIISTHKFLIHHQGDHLAVTITPIKKAKK